MWWKTIRIFLAWFAIIWKAPALMCDSMRPAIRSWSMRNGSVRRSFCWILWCLGKDGLELCRQIRQSVSLASIPVIFLTAKSGEADRVLGLELGADDYIPKPFSPRELVARVKAVLRRFERPLPAVPTKIDDVHIDPGAMTLTVRGKQVPTTATEFRLLDYFMRHAGRVFTRDQLLDSVWRDTAYVTPRSVDVYVRRIREKIEPDPENPRYLKTVRGAGYRFEVAR
jgi:DNA-binding response OmpR family regulator